MLDDKDCFIDEATVANRLSIPLKSLRDRRERGTVDIPFVRLGKRQIRYHWPSVLAHLTNQPLLPKRGTKKPTLLTITVPGRRGRPRL